MHMGIDCKGDWHEGSLWGDGNLDWRDGCTILGVLVALWCLTLCNSMDYMSPTRLLCPWNCLYNCKFTKMSLNCIPFFFFLVTPHSLWDLISLTRDWTWALAQKAPNPNHCTAREFPRLEPILILLLFIALFSVTFLLPIKVSDSEAYYILLPTSFIFLLKNNSHAISFIFLSSTIHCLVYL